MQLHHASITSHRSVMSPHNTLITIRLSCIPQNISCSSKPSPVSNQKDASFKYLTLKLLVTISWSHPRSYFAISTKRKEPIFRGPSLEIYVQNMTNW